MLYILVSCHILGPAITGTGIFSLLSSQFNPWALDHEAKQLRLLKTDPFLYCFLSYRFCLSVTAASVTEQPQLLLPQVSFRFTVLPFSFSQLEPAIQ